ncbi:TolC family protein [Magnetovibrio sp.]|uniref:TolC family protein n=1 Tax=Magnetovibrio sp. TaxID=2024836 RepID=UPI002F953B8C
MRTPMSFKAALLGSILFVSQVPSVNAAGLVDELSALLVEHQQIKAAEADLAAARANVDVAGGGYYPTASITANLGNEHIATHNPTSTRTTTSMAQREVDLSLKQTVWDFGATAATVDGSKLAVEQAQATLEQTRQAILLAALRVTMNVASAKRVLDHQTKSEASIKRQTELEDARVQRGSGFATDTLQAKTQLAGAQAARVRAEGTLRQSLNRYRAVFGAPPADIAGLELPNIKGITLPASEEDVVTAALENNPQVKIAGIQVGIADSEISRVIAANYRPVISASAEQKYKRDVGGTLGVKNERLVKVEATFDFNMGWTAANTLLATKSGYAASSSRLKDTRDQIEEQARNAWQSLVTARANADFLKNQANIASEFLDLARKERTLGQRSLIDVLSGETSLINALAAADRAETDVAIATLTVLNVMGQLDLSVLK